MKIFTRGYRWFRTFASGLQSPMLLFIRLYWGWQFILQGQGKLNDLGAATAHFAGFGIPGPHGAAIFVAWVEYIGGMLLMVGLLSRIVAFALAIDMIVAYFVAMHAALFAFFSNPHQFEAANPFSYLFAASVVFIFGPGLFSIDTLVAALARMRRL